MSKKVIVKFDILDVVNKEGAYTSKLANELGSEIILGIKKAVKSGLSPVAGYGRFIGYKGQIEGNKNKYPYNADPIYGKKVRPVNLTLSGDMLGSIYHKLLDKTTLEIGIDDPVQVKKAEAHNEGLHPDVPIRKFLPTWDGEVFIVSIQRRILDIVRQRISDMIKTSNKK
jgi:hypothetical protein